MTGEDMYWAKVAAIGQVAGAGATFLAVLVSLFLAFHGRKPRVRLKVGERLITDATDDWPAYLMFEISNAGERPFHIRGIGWRTGWLRWGPGFLRRKAAVQVIEPSGLGQCPPFEVQPGACVSCYRPMDDFLESAHDREEPMFTRDWPLIGRRATRIRAYAFTADGHTFEMTPEKSLREALTRAECGSK